MQERIAANYSRRPPAPQRSPANDAPRLTAEQQRAQRDALHSRTSLTQRMAAMLSGPSSYTIPASPERAEYFRKVDSAGVSFAVATRMLDNLLAGSVPADAPIAEVRAAAAARGIDSESAQVCLGAYLAIGDGEPAK